MMNYIKSTSSEIELTNRTDLYLDMMLYSYLIRPSKEDVKHFYSEDKETLILLQEESLPLKYEGKETLSLVVMCLMMLLSGYNSTKIM